MMTRFTKSIFLLVGILFFVPVAFVHGQFVSDQNQESIAVSVTPENPKPKEAVTFKVTSYFSNLDKATISWYVNGKKSASGTGLRTFTTTLGPTGTNTTIEVAVTTYEGNVIRKTFPFRSASVDLIWEADSYTPPLYKGKALFTQFQTGKVIAIPQIGASSNTLSTTNLNYTWKVDGKVVGSVSGYGKNVLKIDESMTARATTISVVVSNQAGTINAEESIVIRPTKAKLLTYLQTPTLGTLYNTALVGNLTITDPEINIVATPYFYTTTQSSSPYIRYTWDVNNDQVQNSFDNFITLRKTASTTGTIYISTKAVSEGQTSNQNELTSFSLSY